MNQSTQPRLTLQVSEQDHVLGNPRAAITLVEYGDYECPHCGQVKPIIEDLRQRLGGRLRYVYRHLPLRSTHPHAQLAAEAAEAAAAQGKFWEMHDAIFNNQDALELDDFVRYAWELGLDAHRFRQELEEHVHLERVREDFVSGIESGANGTPTFFVNGVRYDGPWDLESLLEAIDKPLGVQVRNLFSEFARVEASGGILLLLATLTALVWANLPALSEAYFHLWEMDLGVQFARFELSKHLLHWVNDGLMVIFFFVVGLEIKREVTAGELASLKRAALPIAAAVGGMVVPAALYLAFNWGGPGEQGWGVPMATDIAFTLGILTVMGRRVPLSLKVFFTALAIADDLGAVLVIAVFYSSGINWVMLLVGGVVLIMLLGLNRARIYSPLPYALLGIILWLAFLKSGVHPTIAGVLLAMTIPTRPPADPRAMLAQCITLFEDHELPPGVQPGAPMRRQAAIQTLEQITERLQSPAQRMEHNLHPWTTYVILPIFALANAGVALAAGSDVPLIGPVNLGIVLGLVIGKPLGITLFSWLAVRLKLAELPPAVGWAQLFSASWLAGIGFTMALFIANAAFDAPEILASAKLGIFIASLLAGLVGAGLLILTSPRYDVSSAMLEPSRIR